MKKFACMAIAAMASCCSIKPVVIVAKPQEPVVVQEAPAEIPVLVQKPEPFIVPEQKPDPVVIAKEEEKPAVNEDYSKIVSLVFAVFLSILAVLGMVWLDYRKKASLPPVLPLNEENPSQG